MTNQSADTQARRAPEESQAEVMVDLAVGARELRIANDLLVSALQRMSPYMGYGKRDSLRRIISDLGDML